MKKLLMFLVLAITLISFATAEVSTLNITSPTNNTFFSSSLGLYSFDMTMIATSSNDTYFLCYLMIPSMPIPFSRIVLIENNTPYIFPDFSINVDYGNVTTEIITYCEDNDSVSDNVTYSFTHIYNGYTSGDLPKATLDGIITGLIELGSWIGVLILVGLLSLSVLFFYKIRRKR